MVAVHDGDSVVLRTHEGKRVEVRLNAIDAPEKGRQGLRGQAYAERSRRHLKTLVSGRHALLDSEKTDAYGRRVGVLIVETSDGPIDAGLYQVRSGMAWVYTRYLDELPPPQRQAYRDAEAQARAERRGLWQAPAPEPPWQWRRRHERR